MTSTVKVLSICGSVRRGSFNRALLHAAEEIAPAGLTIASYAIDTMPFFSPDGADREPQAVTRFKEAIDAAHALLIATPEYNCGVPAVLKNAIDWASQPLDRSVLAGKPAAILGCSTSLGGTVRAQMQLRQTLQYVRVQALLQPELFVSHAQTRFDAAGRLVDAATRNALARLLSELLHWTVRLQAAGFPRPAVAVAPSALSAVVARV